MQGHPDKIISSKGPWMGASRGLVLMGGAFLVSACLAQTPGGSSSHAREVPRDGVISSTCAPWDGPAFTFKLAPNVGSSVGALQVTVFERLPTDLQEHVYSMGSQAGKAHISTGASTNFEAAHLTVQRIKNGQYRGRIVSGSIVINFILNNSSGDTPQFCG